jgi:FixJ family two-component response regulator
VTQEAPTIAVVDDEAAVRTTLGRLLKLAGFAVLSYESGESFLAAVAEQPLLCAVLDIHMPGMSGLDVLARLRAGKAELPVILITAGDDPSLEHAAYRAGAVCLLRKPFSNASLLEAIASARDARGGGRA